MISIVVLSGPTASGKSQLALELARRLNGELVSADSMQLYQELNIGVAKPSQYDLSIVPNHLINVLSIRERMSVHRYKELAELTISEISSRGKLPIIVGGTGLYIKALLYGLDELPNDPKLRQRLDEEYDAPKNFDKLKATMARLDSDALKKFENCQRKMIRALEVKLLTGKSILELQRSLPLTLRYRVFGRYLTWEPDELRKRIHQRAEAMLANGWIEECRQMLANGLLNTPTAHQALGYRLIGDFLAGNLAESQLLERISTATWQFARRQRTWFKHQMPESLPLPMPCNVESLIEEIRQFTTQ